MFCTNCGKPTEDDKTLCAECAAENQAPMDLNSPEKEQAPKPNNKKALIIGVIAAVAVIAVVIACLFLFNKPTPQEYLTKVETNALKDSALGDYYETVRTAVPVDPDHANTDITLTFGEGIPALLSTLLSSGEGNVDISWLQEILLEVDVNNGEEISATDIGLGVNATRLLTLRAIADAANGAVYVGVPELTSTYLKGDLAALGIDLDAMTTTMEASGKAMEALEELPEYSEFASLASKYLTMMLTKVDAVEQTTENVVVGDISQKMTVLTATISEETFRDILVAVLESAQNDEGVKAFLTAFCNYANEVSAAQGVTVTVSAEDILALIPEALEELKATEITSTEVLTYKVFVDKKDRVCGRTIILPENAGTLRHMTVRDADDFSFIFEAISEEETVSITGSGDDKNKTYTLLQNENELLTLELADLDTKALERGDFLGTAKLRLGKALWEDMKGEMGAASLVLGAAEPTIQLISKENSAELGLYMGEKMIVNFKIAMEKGESAPATVPTDVINIASKDTAALMELLPKLDTEAVFENMTTAGVPKDMVDSLRQAVALLQALASMDTAEPGVVDVA